MDGAARNFIGATQGAGNKLFKPDETAVAGLTHSQVGSFKHGVYDICLRFLII